MDSITGYSPVLEVGESPRGGISLGDLAVKIFVALVMLIPFRLLLGTLKAVKA